MALSGKLLLNNRLFWRLWTGLFISRLGDQFTIIALLWFVLQLTGSGLALASVLLCFSLPGLFSSPILGRLLDHARLQPRIVMGLDNLFRTLAVGAIPVLFWSGLLQIWLVYLLAALAGLTAPATNIGVRVVLPEMIKNNELESANGLLSLGEQISYLAGPALAGFLVALLGGPSVVMIDALSFLVMTLVLFSLPDVARLSPAYPAEADGTVATLRGKLLERFKPLFQLKEVWLVSGLSFVFFLAYGPLEPALPLFTQDRLAVGAEGYGLLWAAFGVGALVGLLAIPFLSTLSRPGVVFAAIAILWGLCLIPFLWIKNLEWAMLCLSLGGLFWAPYTTVEISMLQRLIPAHLRGQVFGARATLVGAAGPLGLMAGGFLLTFLEANYVIGLSALACILAGVAGLLSPPLRRITRVTD
ncbi:MAG TPA: MFS transporter [Chloroflexia bacterium]|nr:MFS transporter [Chloroflexia bacterium]